MYKTQAHLCAARHRVRTDHGLPRDRERGRVGACRTPAARASATCTAAGRPSLAPGPGRATHARPRAAVWTVQSAFVSRLESSPHTVISLRLEIAGLPALTNKFG